nr:hypothetical protein [Tanacetum cinerariifolium]
MADSQPREEGAPEMRLENIEDGDCFLRKSQRILSKSRMLSHLRRSERLENQSKSKENPRGERARSMGKRTEQRVDGSDTESERGSKDSGEDLSTHYKGHPTGAAVTPPNWVAAEY